MKMRCLWHLLFLAGAAQAEIFGISDKSYPHVYITDPVQAPVVAWHKKAFGFRLSSCAAVRINSRGIRFIPGWHPPFFCVPGTKRLTNVNTTQEDIP